MSAVCGLGIGQSNDWHTPAAVFGALGCSFDLDVSAPDTGPLFVPATRWIAADSLAREWHGFVWMNPPFGGRNGIAPWLDKFLAHGNGIALTPDRASAPWFQDSWHAADAILFCRKMRFHRPDGSLGGSPAFGTALWAVGERGVAALHRAASRGFGRLALTEAAA